MSFIAVVDYLRFILSRFNGKYNSIFTRENALRHRKEIIISILAFLLFSSITAAGVLTLTVPGKNIELSSDSWTKAKDETNFVKNYEETKLSSWHEFGRMVTIYLIPMSVDRRIGLKVSDSEYLEFFIVNPGFVTVQTRLDKGNYWVLCRETFKPKSGLPVDVSSYKPFLTERENRLLWQLYQPEVDETRYLLISKF